MRGGALVDLSGWLAIGSDLDADAVGASRSNAPAATIERHEARTVVSIALAVADHGPFVTAWRLWAPRLYVEASCRGERGSSAVHRRRH